MTYYVCSYCSTVAPYGCSKDAKAWAGVLRVRDGQDSGVVDNDVVLTLKNEVRFRGWTEIAECDTCTASGLVDCESWQDENWLYRPSVGETAGAHYEEWLVWHVSEKDCLLCKKGCQFWSGVCVDRGWTP